MQTWVSFLFLRSQIHFLQSGPRHLSATFRGSLVFDLGLLHVFGHVCGSVSLLLALSASRGGAVDLLLFGSRLAGGLGGARLGVSSVGFGFKLVDLGLGLGGVL